MSLASLESVALPDRTTRGAEVLHDVSFRVEPGQLVALVGPSGAGKTTITQLVSRLYDATAGAVRIGGHDVRDVTLESLHDAVGVVTQDAHMFHDTIRANLLYARPDATEASWCGVRGRPDLGPDLGLPDGLDTVVGDRGYRLSGGEKQRIAIARLLLKAPSSWCSTRPPRTSTRSPRSRFSARWRRRSPGARRWSSRTGCRPSGTPT